MDGTKCLYIQQIANCSSGHRIQTRITDKGRLRIQHFCECSLQSISYPDMDGHVEGNVSMGPSILLRRVERGSENSCIPLARFTPSPSFSLGLTKLSTPCPCTLQGLPARMHARQSSTNEHKHAGVHRHQGAIMRGSQMQDLRCWPTDAAWTW